MRGQKIQFSFEIFGLQVKIDYFFKEPTSRIDSDNISKNVLDALKGVGYIDDNQVDQNSLEMHNLNEHSLNYEEPMSSETLEYWRLNKESEFLSIYIRQIRKLSITSLITSKPRA